VFILCSLLLFFVLFYHRWPLFEDHGIFHYAAWGIAQGLVPYVDIVDVNWPGIYVIHYLARLISGSSPLGLRLVDSLHVAAACAVLSFVLGELGVGRPLRILCLTAYLMSYFFGGYNNTAQRESFGLGMLLLGCWPWVRIGRHRRPPSVIWFFLSGLLMASAVFIRPQVAPLGLVFVAWGFLPDWRNRSAWWPLVAYGAGGVLLCSLGVVWLDRLGSLRGFWDWSVAFALTEYKAWRLPLASMAGYLIRNVTTRGGGFSTLLLLAALGLLLRERDWRALLRSHIRVLALGGYSGRVRADCLVTIQGRPVPLHSSPVGPCAERRPAALHDTHGRMAGIPWPYSDCSLRADPGTLRLHAACDRDVSDAFRAVASLVLPAHGRNVDGAAPYPFLGGRRDRRSF